MIGELQSSAWKVSTLTLQRANLWGDRLDFVLVDVEFAQFCQCCKDLRGQILNLVGAKVQSLEIDALRKTERQSLDLIAKLR